MCVQREIEGVVREIKGVVPEALGNQVCRHPPVQPMTEEGSDNSAGDRSLEHEQVRRSLRGSGENICIVYMYLHTIHINIYT